MVKIFNTLLILFSLNTFAQSKVEVRTILKETATNQLIPYKLLLAICKVESSLNPLASNTNEPNGYHSHGLCQIQYRTAKWLGFKGKVEHLYYAKINALWAAKYIKYQLKKYKGNWNDTIAAYNAGKVYKRNGKYINQVYVNKVNRYLK